MVSKQPNLVTRFMQEPIEYGGLVLRRIDVLQWMREDKVDPRAYDWFVYARPALPEGTPLTPKSIIDAFKAYLKEQP